MSLKECGYAYGRDYPYLQDMLNKTESLPYNAWLATRAYLEVFFPLRLKPGQSLLDVGSCLGNLGHYLQFTGIRTTGIDINLEALRTGQVLYGQREKNITIQANAVAIPFSKGAFNAVVSQDLLEHLPTEHYALCALAEMSRVLRGRKMLHKITVLEDEHWIHSDPSHIIKKPAQWWRRWFENQGWNIISPTTRRYPVWSRKKAGFHKMHGYFLIERS